MFIIGIKSEHIPEGLRLRQLGNDEWSWSPINEDELLDLQATGGYWASDRLIRWERWVITPEVPENLIMDLVHQERLPGYEFVPSLKLTDIRVEYKTD